ncbi:MAG: 50S ribosomal protein L6 [Flavobacteriales bacterium]|nr:50S ribosomal protein L6 [Flavobacteriales bacterium]
MSRIGNAPIELPKGVEIKVENGLVTVKGPKGVLTQKVDDSISVDVDGNTITLKRHTEEIPHKAKHGLYRALINNMVEGVFKGYKVEQELVGVGYRASNTGQNLELALGYSHNIVFQIPAEVKLSTVNERGKNPIIILESHDKQLIGHVAAKIRSLRKPEPYKGKGIRFVGEVLRRKAGKSASKK